MEPTHDDVAERLTYDETVRATSEQDAHVESLRARGGVLLSVAAISTSFLGSQVLGSGGSTAFAWFGLCGFAATSTLCVFLLWPRSWEFPVVPHDFVTAHLASGEPRSTHLDQAGRLFAWYTERHRGAEQLTSLLRLVSISLAFDVILWLIAIAVR